MRKIKIFLASSNELESDRRRFEIEIYRKTKSWFAKGVFLHLDIWEDLSSQMNPEGSQHGYNEYVTSADIFVLLAKSKVGRYTEEEFDRAFGKFKASRKPFIFTYFRDSDETQSSLIEFKKKLLELGHFISDYENEEDLWQKFNKELDRLDTSNFNTNRFDRDTQYDEQVVNLFKIQEQKAEQVLNIGKIETLTFNKTSNISEAKNTSGKVSM